MNTMANNGPLDEPVASTSHLSMKLPSSFLAIYHSSRVMYGMNGFQAVIPRQYIPFLVSYIKIIFVQVAEMASKNNRLNQTIAIT